MKHISTSSLSDLKSVFNSADDNVHFYKVLKNAFNINDFGVELAQPSIRQNSGQIIWKADTVLDFSTIDSADGLVREEAGQMMRQAFEAFDAKIKGVKNFPAEISSKIKEIPSASSVLVARSDNGLKVVITNWGFLEDTLDRNSGILESLFPAPSYSILVRALSETDVPFSGKTVKLESASKNSNDISDVNGYARMGGLTRGERFSLKDGNDRLLAADLVADGTREYIVRFPKEIKLKIQAVNSNHDPLAFQNFEFNSDTIGKFEFSTDGSGEYTIDHPVSVSDFQIYYNGNEVYTDKIPNEDKLIRLTIDPPEDSVISIVEDEEPYIIDELEPLTIPVNVKFTNFWNRPIKNQAFTISDNTEESVKAVTNDIGEASITALSPGEKNIKFEKKSLIWNYSFAHNSGDTLHHFRPRGIYPWLWWLLCALLLFLFLCCFFNYESCDFCRDRDYVEEHSLIGDDVVDHDDDLDRYRDSLGGTTGDITITLSWNTTDDLDLHLIEPSGEEIYYKHKRSISGGELDIDMNAGENFYSRAIENIYYTSLPSRGRYKIKVNYYKRNESNMGQKVPYQVYIKIGDKELTLDKHISIENMSQSVYKFDL